MKLPVSEAPPTEQSPQQDYSFYLSGVSVCSADLLISEDMMMWTKDWRTGTEGDLYSGLGRWVVVVVGVGVCTWLLKSKHLTAQHSQFVV